MKLSFKDYTIISDAFIEMQLDENAIQDLWAHVKKKLGMKATDDQIEAEIERLKKTKGSDLDAIKKTAQSRAFHARKAADEKRAALQARKPEPTRGTLGQPKGALTNADWDDALDSRDRKFLAKRDRVAEGEEVVQLDEAQKEYRVEYTTKLSNADSKVKVAKIKAMDVAAVREKFKRDFHGMKLLTIKPA